MAELWALIQKSPYSVDYVLSFLSWMIRISIKIKQSGNLPGPGTVEGICLTSLPISYHCSLVDILMIYLYYICMLYIYLPYIYIWYINESNKHAPQHLCCECCEHCVAKGGQILPRNHVTEVFCDAIFLQTPCHVCFNASASEKENLHEIASTRRQIHGHKVGTNVGKQ